MLLDSADVCKRAVKLELKDSRKISLRPASLAALDHLLLDVYGILLPKPNDYEQRTILIKTFDKMAREIFGNKKGFPVVEAFGSFTMDLFTAESDLDLSVNFDADSETDMRCEKKISVLRKFAKVLYSHQRKGRVSGVLPIMTAKVPVLKVIDNRTRIECDISVENKDGITRSRAYTLVSSIDERFRILSYLMKAWAKVNGINCPKDRTMSSMSIISLVAFHLQTRNPPILPAFSSLLKDGSDFASIQKNVLLYKQFGSRNKESVAELFISLLIKLSSVESLWELGLCASNYEGSWITKTSNTGVGNLSVEDFLDRSQNFARSVGKMEMQTISECFQFSVLKLSQFMDGQIEASKLKILLFGSLHQDDLTHRSLQDKVNLKRTYPINHSDAQFNPSPGKRIRHTVALIQSGRAPHIPSIESQHRYRINQALLSQPTHQIMPSEPLVAPYSFRYGLQWPEVPVTHQIGQRLPNRPPDYLFRLNYESERHERGYDTVFPVLPTEPPVNVPHPYNGTLQFQLDQSRSVPRLPFGVNPNIWGQ